MNPAIVVLGYSEAAMFLRGTPEPGLVGIISIHGRREFGVEAETPRRLDLTFDDIDVPDAGDAFGLQRAMGRKRWAERNGLVEVPPGAADAAAIVAFAEALRGTEGTLLCHCGGGMSRAPAAALICLAVWAVSRARRGAVPHRGLVRFADDLLGRGGRLVEALAGRAG